jgi:hypothetical protein
VNEKRDIYLRAHTVVLDKPNRPSRGTDRAPQLPKWPEFALVFGCESRTDIAQELTFGFYRILRLNGETYSLEEEGAFLEDRLRTDERHVLEAYFRKEVADTTFFPPHFPLRSRSDFINSVFYKYARKGALLVGFDLCYALGRLARKWTSGDRDEWSLALSVFPDGNENECDPRVLIAPLGSKKAFIRFRAEFIPKNKEGRPLKKRTEIYKARFLDLRTILAALSGKTLSLKAACALGTFQKCNLPQKNDYSPTGQVTVREIEEGRQSVRCMAALLNTVRTEFDLHPIPRGPYEVFSPASFVKGYLDAMGLVPPAQKFDVSNKDLGIAMEAFSAGRSETRIRHVEVPVAPLDFMSEYPTVAALMELMDIVRAKELTFEDATADVQAMLESMSIHKCFQRRLWPDLRFFALVVPQRDVFPVRTMHGGFTASVGNDYLTDKEPIWFAGPDVVNSVLQTEKVPRILRAIRLVPHGKQRGLRTVKLRGAVRIDPRRDDLFRKVIEERREHRDDKDLYHWLKIFANSIYGCFVELNPETLPQKKAARVRVYSGEKTPYVTNKRTVVERPGPWYAPYLGALITSGGRLLLGMLERCVEGWGGTYVWADTDALAVVSAAEDGCLSHVPGCQGRRILPHSQVQEIIDRFADLNPYKFGGSILRFLDCNYVDSDPNKGFRELLGFSISAKRYCIYERDGGACTIIDPKAHGLGYVYPPSDSPPGWDEEHEIPKWVYEGWEWLVRHGNSVTPNHLPSWSRLPQMMRMAVNTYGLLKRLHRWNRFRPFNFFFAPVLANCGQPANVDPQRFTLITRFERDQSKWMDAPCFNIDHRNDTKEYKLATVFDSPHFGERPIVETFEELLYRYFHHPESKSLGPDGEPCHRKTRGRLERPHVMGGKRHRIGKEVDRRWEAGDDLESLRQAPNEYTPAASRASGPTVIPGPHLGQLVRDIGIRKLMRQGFGRRILQKITRRQPLNASTYRDYERRLEKYANTTRRKKSVRSPTSQTKPAG